MQRRRDRILVVDDDDGVRSALRRALTAAGYELFEAECSAGAEAAALAHVPDLALLDLRLPDGDGIELIQRLKATQPGLAVIVLTGHGSIDTAVSAMKRGADQFLTKPVDMEALRLVMQRVLQDRRNLQRQWASRAREGEPRPLIGASPAFRQFVSEVEQVLDADLPMLLLGETGTGKGLMARWLHARGPRSAGPFVDLNCAGISRELLDAELFGYEAGAFTGAVKAKPGLLEVAHGGTFFLDEIGDMDLAIQARLLKVLEEKRFRRLGDVRDRAVDVRLIAATHQDLARLMREGRFRQDLYFRVSAIELRLPALRERGEDLEPLARSILEDFAREVGRPVLELGAAALDSLRAYDWPGNVRELRNVLESAALRRRSGTLVAEDLRLRASTPAPAAMPRPDEQGAEPGQPLATLAEIERAHIQRAIEVTGGHVARAARLLGISTSSMYERVRRLGLPISGLGQGGTPTAAKP